MSRNIIFLQKWSGFLESKIVIYEVFTKDQNLSIQIITNVFF
jgi:hypothetical protein